MQKHYLLIVLTIAALLFNGVVFGQDEKQQESGKAVSAQSLSQKTNAEDMQKH